MEDSMKEYELRILRNFIDCMPKTYRRHNSNYMVVRDILMNRTRTAGQTSCMKKCIELGIDPYEYSLDKKTEVQKCIDAGIDQYGRIGE